MFGSLWYDGEMPVNDWWTNVAGHLEVVALVHW